MQNKPNITWLLQSSNHPITHSNGHPFNRTNKTRKINNNNNKQTNKMGHTVPMMWMLEGKVNGGIWSNPTVTGDDGNTIVWDVDWGVELPFTHSYPVVSPHHHHTITTSSPHHHHTIITPSSHHIVRIQIILKWNNIRSWNWNGDGDRIDSTSWLHPPEGIVELQLVILRDWNNTDTIDGSQCWTT